MASEAMKEGKRQGRRRRRRRKKRRSGRRKMCKFCADESIKIDYKDASLLKYFITDRGKLVPRRLIGQLRQAPARDRRWRSTGRG